MSEKKKQQPAAAAANGLPPAPPGCRWMTEGPDGSLIDLQQQHEQQEELDALSSGDEGASADAGVDAAADAAAEGEGPPKELLLHPQLLESRRRWLLAACESAGDTVCAMAVNKQQQEQQQQQQQQQQQVPPFLAVGASDDICRLYDLSQLSPPPAAAAAAGDPAAATRAEVEEQHLNASVTLRDAGDSVSCVSFSSDGLLLACGSFDGSVRVYSTQAAAAAAGAAQAGAAAAGKRMLLQELRGPCEGVSALAFHPRGYALLAAAEDQTAWVWLLPPSWGSAAAAAAAAEGTAAEGGAAAAAGEGTKGKIKPAATLHVFAASSPLTCCCFSSSGSRCIVGGASGSVSFFAARDGQMVSDYDHPSRDPQARAAVMQSPLPITSSSSSSSGMDVDDGEGGQGAVCLAVYTPQSCCYVGYEDGYILCFNEETGKILVSLKAHAGAVESLLPIHPNHSMHAANWGPQGAPTSLLLFSAGLDGIVRLWNLSKKTLKLSFDCTHTPIPQNPSSTSDSNSSSSSSSGDNSSRKGGDGEGVVRLLLHPQLPLLLAGTSYGLMRAFNCSSSNSSNVCVDMWTAHPSAVMDLQHISSSSNSNGSSRNWIVASGDSDGGVDVWALDPTALLQGKP
ncbi:WD domain, G-beta repeat-containing protein, putative [Eimeria maxima]|uniref:WD domain, G-beta repeat-containing protein, putative n=1 Tax=Eimeria maxima TaxID=5804 RepID=U6LZJ3_EIMMA|nr:WD domain, G-beta repeat-containing protein, putative [Eimeria maxima]CDJ57166.1 WD domain, G-beta repeat-containing protein, putative [Eimeria maxima]